MKKTILIASLCCGAVEAATTVDVSQDGFVDFFNGVQDGGTGDKLSVATANPSAAFGYTRVAYFGFDVSAIDLNNVTAIDFTAQMASNVVAAYNGTADLRFTLISNTIADNFDETTLEASNAPGLTQTNPLPGPVANGTILGTITTANPAAGQIMTVSFPALALADLANDTNSFLTVFVESRTENNSGFNDATGLGFDSKESGNGATLEITVIPEPSGALLLTLAGGSFLLRRRR